MKENIEDYRKNGYINLDEYLINNPEGFTYPYYIDGYDEKNFWTKVASKDKEKFIYVKPREKDYLNNEYNVYSELLYEELMKQVGIKNVSFDMAQYDGSMATISENMLNEYSNNQFIINGSELLASKTYRTEDEYNIEDLFDSIHEYCNAEYLEEDVEEKCISDIQKVCIADIFLLSTDRKATDFDFIAGIDKKDEEDLVLAPLCHNTYALGSNFSKDEIIEMLDDYDMMSERINLCYFDAGIPEYKRDYDYPYWEDSLYYFVDEDEKNLDFAEECAKKLNIDDAITKVERRINTKIPEEYKEFVRTAFDTRLRNICQSLNLDYYKIMDNKYYEYEMEEI
ncbi:MAG: hypothetical protein J6A15_09775 [Clostridia bacterium]|nr:hypothetical protein [Clostridia bacterium]